MERVHKHANPGHETRQDSLKGTVTLTDSIVSDLEEDKLSRSEGIEET
jgi:hypothetical protein